MIAVDVQMAKRWELDEVLQGNEDPGRKMIPAVVVDDSEGPQIAKERCEKRKELVCRQPSVKY